MKEQIILKSVPFSRELNLCMGHLKQKISPLSAALCMVWYVTCITFCEITEIITKSRKMLLEEMEEMTYDDVLYLIFVLTVSHKINQ